MKHRTLFHTVALIACCSVFSLLHAISPKPKGDTPDKNDENLPASQEATEESVLPEEPLLSTPTPEPLPEYTGQAVQPLPSGGITQPSGPTVDERRKLEEAFRSAKTEAEEQPTLADIKIRAFAAPTEREKRTLLREYYQAVSGYVIKKSPSLKDKMELWAFAQQNRIGRPHTEPDYVPPAKPDALLKVLAATDSASPSPTPEEKTDFLPALGN